MSATPRPWGLHTRHHGAADICDYVITAGERGEKEVLRVDGRNLNISDFMLIVRAVNVHEELLEAAQKALDYLDKRIGSKPVSVEEEDAVYAALDDGVKKVERT